MEIINIKEVKTIKKINPADGAASRYQSVSFVVSGMRKGMLFKFVISGAAARNASELTGLLLMTSS